VLHAERTNRLDGLRSGTALASLPDGLFVTLAEQPAVAWLVWSGALWRWSPDGYCARRAVEPAGVGRLLTPPATARAVAAGFRPLVHASAHAWEAAAGR
jgi:hypothetical protein